MSDWFSIIYFIKLQANLWIIMGLSIVESMVDLSDSINKSLILNDFEWSVFLRRTKVSLGHLERFFFFNRNDFLLEFWLLIFIINFFQFSFEIFRAKVIISLFVRRVYDGMTCFINNRLILNLKKDFSFYFEIVVDALELLEGFHFLLDLLNKRFLIVSNISVLIVDKLDEAINCDLNDLLYLFYQKLLHLFKFLSIHLILYNNRLSVSHIEVLNFIIFDQIFKWFF